MSLARRIEDHAMETHAFTERFDLTFYDNDGYVVRIDVRFVAGTGYENGGMAVKFPEVGG
jgi:hypothetical protein